MARIQEVALKSGATVTMHTRLGYQEARDLARARQSSKAKDELAQEFTILRHILTGWTLRHVETDELLPFSVDGLRNADTHDVLEIGELIEKLENGTLPNALSARQPAT